MRNGLRVLILGGLLALTGCTSLFFYPMKPWVQNPANQGLDYEDVVLIHKNGLRLDGWWLPAQGPVRGTVYFLHGNAENISTHLMNVAWMPKRGYQVFLLDYRGYGLSEGKPKLPEVFSDIQLGLDWLVQSGRLGDAPLIVFGQSLGGSMATWTLSRKKNKGKVDCAILGSTFSGYDDITKAVMSRSWLLWPFQWPVAAAMPSQYDPKKVVADISPTPILFMSSKDDKVVPFSEGKKVYEAAKQPKEFQALKGPHAAGPRSPAVQQRMVDFINKYCPPPAKEKTGTPVGGREKYHF